METKGIEEMTREELIDLISTLNKELKVAKDTAAMYRNWKDESEAAQMAIEKKLSVVKALLDVL